jgi:DegV family protein with EDD domain
MAIPIRLVVDSTSDLPPAWLARWNIPIVPAYVNFDKESYPDDGVSLSREDFYHRITSAYKFPTTSAPSPGKAQEVIRAALADSEHVVVFTVASQYSSIYNTVRLAAGQVDPNRVTVIDSGSMSMGLGWQVVAAAEAVERGASLAEMLLAADSVRVRSEIWAAVGTLDHLRRSGRVNALVAGIGTLLQIKPIITLNKGTAATLQRVRTMTRAIQAIIERARTFAPLERLAILHTHYPEGARILRDALLDIAPTSSLVPTPAETPVFDVNIGMAVHFGPGTLGISLVRAIQD